MRVDDVVPFCTDAMELSAQLERWWAELFLVLEWTPRDANREADRLAGGRLEGFDPALRVRAELSEARWLVLNDLLGGEPAVLQSVRT